MRDSVYGETGGYDGGTHVRISDLGSRAEDCGPAGMRSLLSPLPL